MNVNGPWVLAAPRNSGAICPAPVVAGVSPAKLAGRTVNVWVGSTVIAPGPAGAVSGWGVVVPA